MAKYKVLAPTFVNGTYYAPRSDGKPLVIEADDGLEGAALEIWKGKTPSNSEADGDANQ